MFGRWFDASNTHGSNDAGFESASFCASFFAALLLLIDTVIAVSIFVSADIAAFLCGLMVSAPVNVFFLRVLLEAPAMRRSKPLAA